ncbi:T9SS type A sorting domain-containing protein [Flavilitoribacter nigricans]|nr:T9SS type A sorting domain-containing protein [Flavilitoribacter nigricans]
MNINLYRWLCWIGLLVIFTPVLPAQITVYPGDANDNGIVNNIDVLYIGYSFGTPGPSRVLTDTDFEPQEAAAAWSDFFPDGTSYASADANGDGLIGTQDLLTVFRNYGATRPPVIPDDFPEPPDGGSQLYMTEDGLPDLIQPGTSFSIPIYLNDVNNPLELNGLAFSFEYDEQVVKEVRLEWAMDWFRADSSWYGLQVPEALDEPQLDIAATRFGDNPVIGGGLLGRVNIIIEDDLIGLLPAPTDTIDVIVSIKKIRGIGKNFEPIPIGGDDYQFTVYHPDAKTNPVTDPDERLFTVYPNPVQEELRIEAQKIIKKIILYDLLGRPMLVESRLDSTEIQLPVMDLPPGLYLLQVQTEGGISSREILIE